MDIETILNNLGITIGVRAKSCFYCSTDFRGGDSPNGLVVNSNGWCFDLITGENLHITQVAALKLGCSIEQARQIVGSNIEVEEEEEPEVELVKTFPPEYFLDNVPSFNFYLNKGISKETLLHFKCGLSLGGRDHGRLVFPIYHKSGEIRGSASRCVSAKHEAARKLDPGYKRKKWVNRGAVKNWDYPFFFVKDYIRASREIILVESIGDLASLFDAGIKNVLVLFGLNLSDEMMLTILSSNPKRILIALNNDLDKGVNRGQEAAKKIRKKLEGFFDKLKIIDAPPERGDFGDISSDKPAIHAWAARNNVEIFGQKS